MIRKSGVANRVADLRIDRVAKEAATVVRQARDGRASERFLSRFLDHLHDADNAAHGLGPLGDSAPDNPSRRRWRG